MTIKVTYNVTDVYMSQSVSPVYINVSYSDGGASGGGVWGSITGTLSNQTDLQTALDAKLDESTIDGGTEGQILSKASGTDFDFAWINNYAKYLATNVRNQTGSTIGAFQVVYISGATGNKPLISLADADTEATSSKTYGVTATSIANNGTGDVVTAGELSGINTSAFNEGDLLWLSTTAGGVVTSPPAEPAHAVFIGYVVRSHPTLGVIDVAIANGYELNELHGVQITTPTDNQGLFYNSTSTLWENKSITTALGYTPVPTTRNITINGVTYDLSADRTWTISTGISGSGASGQVTYWTGSSAVSGSNNLFWDNTNSRLGIGTNVPSAGLDVGSANPPHIRVFASASPTYNTTYNTSTINFSGSNQTFSIQNNSTSIARFHSTNNFTLGTTSDLGVRFGVVGDTLLRGSGNTGATTALTVQNSDGTTIFRVRNDQRIFGASFNVGNTLGVAVAPVASNNVYNVDGEYLSLLFAATNTAGFGVSIGGFYTSQRTATSGESGVLNAIHGFAPTSGTGTFTGIKYTGTINQTGGANGITRGLYIIPTLTAAADWRSIQWDNNSGWGLYGAGSASNYLAGNLGIGITPTVKLHVSGDTILKGSGATSATAALTVQNSDGTNLIRYYNGGIIEIGNAGSGAATRIYPYTTTFGAPDLTGRNLQFLSNATTQSATSGAFYFTGINFSQTSGNQIFVNISNGFAPTSGTGTLALLAIQGTINQTGGANGITRGLYVNPTLTSAADFRAIETTSGKIVFGNLPTSSAGLPTGALWNDAGTVKIV